MSAMRNGRMLHGTRAWVLAVLMVCSVVGTEGQGQGQTPPEALLRTTTRPVQTSVIAYDKKGEPVEDLTTTDSVKAAKLYRLILVRENKPITDEI